VEGGVVVVFITAPRGKGEDIARELLERRLVACANVTEVRSLYWWRGKIEGDNEDLIVAKTTASRLEDLINAIKEIHPYEVPEVIALPVLACNEDYCRWVREETKSSSKK